ncbi:MAG: response regulator [Calditrichia bacterium]
MFSVPMKKILVAEDDKNLSRSLDTWLTLEGFQVVTVYNGEEALNKLLQQRFDLLITDLVMPRLGGVELIEKIRQVNQELPIMVVSGNLGARVIKQIKAMGVDLMLPKPIKPAQFRKVIGQVFPESALI